MGKSNAGPSHARCAVQSISSRRRCNDTRKDAAWEESSPLAGSSKPSKGSDRAARCDEDADTTKPSDDARRDQSRRPLQRLRLQRGLAKRERGRLEIDGNSRRSHRRRSSGEMGRVVYALGRVARNSSRRHVPRENLCGAAGPGKFAADSTTKFWGMFSPWSDEDDSLDKIYAVQSDPVAQVVPHYEVGFEPEEVLQAGVAPWSAIQA